MNNESLVQMNSIKSKILAQHPEFREQKKHPRLMSRFYLILFLIFIFSAYGLSATHFSFSLLFRSVLLGVFYSSLAALTHELLHGAKTPLNSSNRILAGCGFFIFGLSPELWLTWHHQIHHSQATDSGKIEAGFGIKQEWISKWSYALYLFYISYQVAVVTWVSVSKGDPKLFRTLNQRAVIFETLSIYLLWFLFLVVFGWKSAVMTLLIPSLVANLILSSYILSRHLFRPLSLSDDLLKLNTGVVTDPFLDQIHFNFSHHAEHFLFPEMDHTKLPKLREILQAEYPDRYKALNHWSIVQKRLGLRH